MKPHPIKCPIRSGFAMKQSSYNEPDLKNPDLRIGLSIQDTENPPGFVCDKCTVFHRCQKYDDAHITMKPTCDIDKDVMKMHGCIPNRCNRCSRWNKRWQLGETYKRNLVAKFDKRRHHHIRMVQLGWLGERKVEKKFIGSKLKFTREEHPMLGQWKCPIRRARDEMISGLKALREYHIWKEHVDGGIWFFEVTTKPVGDHHMHINPHMHLVLLCPKKFPVEQINNLLFDQNGLVRREGTRVSKLGRCHIHSTRCKKTGKFLKSKPKDAANYLVSYAKRPGIVGKSRNQFGILTKRM